VKSFYSDWANASAATRTALTDAGNYLLYREVTEKRGTVRNDLNRDVMFPLGINTNGNLTNFTDQTNNLTSYPPLFASFFMDPTDSTLSNLKAWFTARFAT